MVDYVTRARDHIAAGENLKAAQLLNDTVGRYLPRIMKLYNYRYLTRLPRDEQDQARSTSTRSRRCSRSATSASSRTSAASCCS